MVFQNNILSGVGGQGAGGFTVDYSCRFNDDDSASLSHTTDGTPTDASKGVFGTWFKRGNLGINTSFITGQSESTWLYMESADKIVLINDAGATLRSSQVLRDTAAWYHIIMSYDSDEGAAADRLKIWLNGVEITSWATDARSNITLGEAWGLTIDAETKVVGAFTSSSYDWDGYLAQTFLIDGTSIQNADHAITAFGEFDDNGVWRPVDVSGLTFGTNGWLLDFADSSDLGNDVSGNSNDFTSSGLAADDQVADTPTTNYCTWNPLWKNSTITLSDGNLKFTHSATSSRELVGSTLYVSSGKFYWELDCVNNGNEVGIGIVPVIFDPTSPAWPLAQTWFYRTGGETYGGGVAGTTLATWTTGDMMSCAIDMDASKIWYGKNGTWENSGDPAAGTGFLFDNLPETVAPFSYAYLAGIAVINCGQHAYSGTVPTGFNNLSTADITTPAILDGTAYFQPTLYTGDGSTRNIDQTENSTFQPDMVWIKNRSQGDSHRLVDAVRGVTKELFPNTYIPEATDANGLTSFDADGFGLGTGAGGYNDNTESFVAWQWLAGGGAGSANAVGSITTNTTTVNTTSGISIGSYTGNNTSGATIGHGLGVVPDFIMCKETSSDGVGGQWYVYMSENTVLGPAEDGFLVFDETQGTHNQTQKWNDTAPTSTVFSIGNDNDINASGSTYTSYVMAGVEGFSNFGFYIGNGLADGPYVFTGFKPAFVITKNAEGSTPGTSPWFIYDSQRSPYNEIDDQLQVNTAGAETTGSEELDFLSNGFKIRTSDALINTSAKRYVFMAFAEYPFGGEDVTPATAF